MQAAGANVEINLHRDDIAVAEHGPNAPTNSHELGAINVSQTNIHPRRTEDGDQIRARSEPRSPGEPGAVPRSRLRLFAVMAALFVSLPVSVYLGGSLQTHCMVASPGLPTDSPRFSSLCLYLL